MQCFREVPVLKGVSTFTHPADCLRDMVSAWADCAKIAEQERTKRRDIAAWEKVELAKIKELADLAIVKAALDNPDHTWEL